MASQVVKRVLVTAPAIQDFRKGVDQAKLTSAIIMANEVPKGRFIQQGLSFNLSLDGQLGVAAATVPGHQLETLSFGHLRGFYG